MRYFLAAIFLLTFINSFAQPKKKKGLKLVWNDEFNEGVSIDKTKWQFEVGHIRNIEEQYYTADRNENCRIENGLLILEARKEKFPNKDYNPAIQNWKNVYANADYTSASITTKNIHSWKFGRIEIRAKLPNGQGVWPAVWMLGANRDEAGYPFCGEIDIMEYTGKDPHKIHGTTHHARDNEGNVISNSGDIKKRKPYKDFHVYAIEWNKKEISFFLDKKKYHTVNIEAIGNKKENPFLKPFYLIINFALGGTWGKTINDKILPQQFQIDYVRVYQ